MPLQILNAGVDATDLLRKALEAAFPGAEIAISSASPGHFELRVVSKVFEGKTRLQQQQLVYRAITQLMSGDAAPVHAIDRMQTLVP
ncbi:MAG TPA: BolA/IbaG family iron-sulfur metabolism protein [Myxococcota bacterium]|nr:BolA/IbaG family iron-sulfur metabolism protein [Myxococcota bacterium]